MPAGMPVEGVGGQQEPSRRPLVEPPGRELAEVHHAHAVAVVLVANAPHEGVDAIGGVVQVVLAEPLGERQVEKQHLAQVDVALEQNARAAQGDVVGRRHLFPGAAVGIEPLNPHGDREVHPRRLASLCASQGTLGE